MIISSLMGLLDWRTKRKIIIIESDDWGSIRMPDKRTYHILLSKGVRVDNCPYTKYDCLESELDLSMLFEVLDGYRDMNGNPPVITANCVTSNPDFSKIRENHFLTYHYELLPETFKRYSKHINSFQLWKEGLDRKFFFPQFHGREHLNVAKWMKAVQSNLPETRLAFDYNLFGISRTITSEKRRSYLAAFDTSELDQSEDLNNIIADGVNLFKNLLGYMPKSFIAPNYIWPSSIEEFLNNLGINYIQGRRLQLSPKLRSKKYRKITHFTGQRNKYGQIYTVRNCRFEPSIEQKKDNISTCLAEINTAFTWGKPGIISSHRLNYIGTIEPINRERNLRKLNSLLSEIIKKWPDVEFMTSVDLGELISNK